MISLALRLTATNPPQWPNWVVSSVGELSSLGLSPENLLDYLAIVAEEAHRSDLAGSARSDTLFYFSIQGLIQSLIIWDFQSAAYHFGEEGCPCCLSSRRGIPLQSIDTVIGKTSGTPLCRGLESTTSGRVSPSHTLPSGKNGIHHVSSRQLGQIIPILLNSLSHPDLFVNASDVISELMTSSALGAGAGTRILTDPLLQWVENEGKEIFQSSVESQSILAYHAVHRVPILTLYSISREH